MKQSEYDFNRCLFNPKAHGFLSGIQKAIPEFNSYKGKLPKGKVFAYIVITFDLNSPLRVTITNYYDRKKLAAELAGWEKKKNDEFEDDVTNMLLGSDEDVNSLVVAYLVQFSMPEYIQLIAYLNMSYAAMRDALSGNFYDDKMAKSIDFLTGKIRELTNYIFGSGQIDEIAAARKALYYMAEKERIKLNPENIVKLKADRGGLPDDFNPYGDYKTDKLKFISDEGDSE
jgi:hypothetical protein